MDAGKKRDKDMLDENPEDSTTTDNLQRKVKKAKRKAKDEKIKIKAADGEEVELEDSEGWESEEDAVEMAEDVVQHDSEDWEEDGIIEDMDVDTRKKPSKKEAKQQPKEIWNDLAEPLKEDEELVYDSSAYEMMHKSNVEWPCLSCDPIIRERSITGPMGTSNLKTWFPGQMCGALDPNESAFDKRLQTNIHKGDRYPMEVYFCGGSQCPQKSDNKIYVMKWSEMEKTVREDEEPSDNSEDDE